MRLALFLPPETNEMWRLGVQMGVDDAVTTLPRNRSGEPVWDYLTLLHLRQRFADAGLNASVIESSPPMNAIRLGLPERDKEIEQVCELLTNMGAVGFTVWCYNFMAVFGWLRTAMSIPARGGALVSGYDHSLMEKAPLTEFGTVSDEQLWESFAYFLERVVPVAEQAGVKLALHPDDPPLSPIRGIARIFRNVEAFKRAIDLYPSEYNGITFCQGNFTAMGADIPETIRYFGRRHKIHFVHFRDVEGTASHFVETFHDNGPTNMAEAMRSYQEIGFSGPIRPDHVPTMDGDANDTPGYTTRGRLYAIGYMKGLLDALN